MQGAAAPLRTVAYDPGRTVADTIRAGTNRATSEPKVGPHEAPL